MTTEVISTLMDIAISYYKAKDNLWERTKTYLNSHFEKQKNSRALIFPIYGKKGELLNEEKLLNMSFKSVYSRQFKY